jgi:hypothetical protein
MRKYFIIFCAFLSATAFSQQPDYNFTLPGIRTPDGGSIDLVRIHEPVSLSSGIYRMKMGLTVRKFSPDGTLDDKIKLKGGTKGFPLHYADIKKLGNDVWVFYLAANDKDVAGDLVGIKINVANFEASEPVVIARGTDMDLHLQAGFPNMFVSFASSPDNNSISVLAYAGKSLYISALDRDMKTMWSKNSPFSKFSKEDRVSQMIDNSGNIYISYINDSKPVIQQFTHSGSYTFKDISLGENDARDVLLLATKKGLAVAGTFLGQKNQITGAWYAWINGETKTISQIQKNNFSADFLEAMNKDSKYWTGSFNKYGLDPALKVSLIAAADGMPDLTGEYRKEMANGHGVAVLNGSMINIKFNEGGALFSRIPRYSVVFGHSYENQYATEIVDGSIFFYFLDYQENVSKDSNLKTHLNDKVVSVGAKIDARGTLTREKINGLLMESL